MKSPWNVFKEMIRENKIMVLQIINERWEEENIPRQALLARVVLIYKKGDTNLCENYRPISLLNSLYKIFIAAIHRRLEPVMDNFL